MGRTRVERLPVFVVENVGVSFGEEPPVFSSLSLEVWEGESLAILGPSGAGKSVLLKMLAGLIRPHQGRILFRDRDLAGFSPPQRIDFARQVGMTFQRGGLFDSVTVGDNLRIPLREVTRLSDPEIEKSVLEALKDVGLEDSRDRMVYEISGGMQKRLGIARALVLSPKTILFDDPTAGLDPITARSINDLILEMKRKYGMTVVAACSDPAQASQLADRAAFVYGGEVLEAGSVEEIGRSGHPVVQQFLKGLIDGPLTESTQPEEEPRLD